MVMSAASPSLLRRGIVARNPTRSEGFLIGFSRVIRTGGWTVRLEWIARLNLEVAFTRYSDLVRARCPSRAFVNLPGRVLRESGSSEWLDPHVPWWVAHPQLRERRIPVA